MAVLDISPTRTMFAQHRQAFATAYYHWFFLIQPFDYPERMIGADPVYYLRHKLGSWGVGHSHTSTRARSPSTSAAFAIRRRSTPPARTIARRRRSISSTTPRMPHRRVECPLLALWGEKGVVHRLFDPLADWRAVAGDVRGRALPCGHYLAEEQPDATLEEFERFFGR